MTQEGEETDEKNFSDELAGDQLRAHVGFEPATLEELEAEVEADEEEEATKPSDPFDDPPPKTPAQRNWLANGIRTKELQNVTMDKKKRGRPKGSVNVVHKRNKAMKEAIQIMTAAGVKKTVMAKILKRSMTYLNDNFSMEMEHGSDILTSKMVNALIQKGLDGNVSAIIFYLKSKAGWREVDRMDTPDGENASISDIERNQRLMSLFMNNPQFKTMMQQKQLEAIPIEVKKDVFDIDEDDDEPDEE